MIKEIKMPDGGQTTDKAVICKFKVKKGDTVKRGDILFEAETDKAILPVESFASGIIVDILCKEGDTVDSETVVLLIGDESDIQTYHKKEAYPAQEVAVISGEKDDDDEYLPISSGKAEKPAPAVSVSPPAPVTPVVLEKAFPVMPNAKKLAQEKNININNLTPANGKFIKKSDIEKIISVKSAAAEKEFEIVPISNIRKVIAKRMLESTQNIPSFQVTIKVNMSNAIILRTLLLDQYQVKVSYNDILMKCVAKAAEKYPLLKTRFENNELKIYKDINIGLAVGLDGSLLVPVVKSVNRKGILEISSDNKSNIEKAKGGKLTVADMGCGTTTISNLGMYDVSQFIAIVNPPENSIFAVGKIENEPVWNEKTEAFEAVPTMCITASFDHRIIDGAYGAAALKQIKLLLENPTLLVI